MTTMRKGILTRVFSASPLTKKKKERKRNETKRAHKKRGQ